MITTPPATVCIVEDNAAVRDSVRWLVEHVGLQADAYSSSSEFLEHYDPQRCDCLVLDIRLPGMSGLDLQEHLVKDNPTLPVIIVTGHGDVPVAVRAMKAGAVDFLQKPFSDQALLDSIYTAIRTRKSLTAEHGRRAAAAEHLANLTNREREVLSLLRNGHSNKEIAEILHISVRTVEGHRAHLMSKVNAKTVGHLIELVAAAELHDGRGTDTPFER